MLTRRGPDAASHTVLAAWRTRLTRVRLRAGGRAAALAFLIAADQEGEAPIRPLARKLAFLVRCRQRTTIREFLRNPAIGAPHGVGMREKLDLVWAFHRNARALETLSTVLEHVELAATLLRIPPSVPGDVVECGCYAGGSSANLSLACALARRRLVICDSFMGLPAPAPSDAIHRAEHIEHTDVYYEGRFAASLEQVRANVARYGNLDVCDFVVGFFEQSLRQFDRPLVMAFVDVDLADSLRTCLLALWPHLTPGGRFYVHEAYDLPFVSRFFDARWWDDALGEPAPGFVGAGSGLPLTAHYGSELGYARKRVLATASPTPALPPSPPPTSPESRLPREETRARDAITAKLRHGDFLADWTGTWLTAAEGVLLERHRPALRGRVLELGMGGGRITAHLLEIADELHGIDIGPDMVAHCRERFPTATFTQLDFRGLSTWEAASWDAVYGGFNTFDVLAPHERDALLGDVARLLRPGGHFLFSAHNRGALARVRKPWQLGADSPLDALRSLPRRARGLRNYARLAHLQRIEADHAIVVDDALDFGLLQMYVSRDAQERALHAHGFELVECLDETGRPVHAGEASEASITLTYVARLK